MEYKDRKKCKSNSLNIVTKVVDIYTTMSIITLYLYGTLIDKTEIVTE